MDEIKTLNSKELREFGLIGGTIIAVFFGLLLPMLRHYTFPIWPWVIAGILGIWAIFAPATLNAVYQIWMRIGLVLGWINTRIILAVVFFGLFTSIGILKRFIGQDTMTRQLYPETKSYRLPSQIKTSESLLKPF